VPSSVDTVAPVTTVATTRATVTVTNPPTTPATPPPTQPGRISATPANGSQVTIKKGTSTKLTLQNVGAAPAQCTVSKGSGNLVLSGNCSPSIPAGGKVEITITAAAGFEGSASVVGAMEGIGSFSLSIFVQNG